MAYAVVVLCALTLALGIVHTEAKCGYKSCPDSPSKYINIHLVPHSHDDVGWLKTVDQYYYGSKTGIQRAGVQYILDSVIDELKKDSSRRFIFVESAFFFKWWDEQSSSTQKAVKKLVDNGQLEFTGGAWSMNDEAAVHYQSVIDQFTIGLKKLDETFGECGRPRVGWQIDPFGHSREMASIFAQMGYDGEFFARMDWVEKTLRLNNKSAEMIWNASPSMGESSEMFTGVLYNHYSAPPGFCFDTLCQDDPIIDGKSADNNVNKKVDEFLGYAKNMSANYKTNNLLIPMGDDFNYQSAGINFKNMDKLIKYVNERKNYGSKVNIFYSTPSCYLKALYDGLQTWPTKNEDFLPYSTDWHSYWTGYYSSRPTQKRFERIGNHFLQVSKQLTTLANLSSTSATSNLDNLRHAMGVMQHHDAITGTEKQKVAQDYDRLLSSAIHDCGNNTRQALQKLTNLTKGEFESCHLANISMCSLSATKSNFAVTLFNPLAKTSKQYVRIPVVNGTYVVTDKSGKTIPSEVVPVPVPVLKMPYRINTTQHELVFAASVSKIETFYVKRVSKPKIQDRTVPDWFLRSRARRGSPAYTIIEKYQEVRATKAPVPAPAPKINNTIVENANVRLNFSSTGHLVAVKMNGIEQQIRQDFFYYRGASGNNEEFKNRSSGAYIFRPNGTEVPVASKVNLTVVKGKTVQEVHQYFTDWVSQVVRIYNDQNRVEFEWLIGPIPIGDKIGKEVITKFTSSIDSKGVFYTDSNGRDMMKRIRNHREKFTANLTETVSGNYYPVTSRIALEDNKSRIAILNDRAQGGSSIQNGSLELMLHRRLLRDDAFGVGEALNDTSYARGKYWLVLSPTQKKLSKEEREMQLEVLLPFWKFFSSNGTDSNVKVPPTPSFSSLPTGIHLLTLEPWSKTEVLLRLEHFTDATESSKINFNLRPLFTELGGSKIRETTLDGSMALDEMKRLKFVEEGSKVKKDQYIKAQHTPLKASKKDKDSKFDVSFGPMQIRSFIITKSS